MRFPVKFYDTITESKGYNEEILVLGIIISKYAITEGRLLLDLGRDRRFVNLPPNELAI